MKKIAWITVFVCVGLLLNGLILAEDESTDDLASGHMVAQAMLAAHFIDAALKAGMSTDDINAVLAKIADQTVISEFWISDEAGRIVFTNVPGSGFVFPTDPEAGTQAAPFAALLDGSESVVIQGAREREYDSRVFQYVGVAGVDRPRIVQVGIAAAEPEAR
jgi:uncharacterized protein YfiM (DUF2279 family)